MSELNEILTELLTGNLNKSPDNCSTKSFKNYHRNETNQIITII
jgi:hypothetical protein